MKDKLGYILIFGFAFVIVTGMMFVMNAKYENMFRFDTRDRAAVAMEKKMQDSIKVVQDSSRAKAVKDSLARLDNPDSLVAGNAEKSSGNLSAETEKHSEGSSSPLSASVATAAKAKLKAEKDSIYAMWKRETVKLYEVMDANQIAKVLPSFSDDVARDLIYSMKKKKAAEVLSLLSPEMIHKLTRAQ